MAERPLTIATCSFFSVRPDRDTRAYYRDPVNDLARKCDLPIVLYTNDPSDFDDRLMITTVNDLEQYRTRIFDAPNWSDSYHSKLGWHKRNHTLSQYIYPQLCSIYLAKMAILFEIVKEHGDVLWIDSGLLFSVYYDHKAVENFAGYSQQRILTQLLPQVREWQRNEESSYFLFPARKRLWKRHRPSFHGMSYNNMISLAKSVGAEPDDWYAAAGCFYLPQSLVAEYETSFIQVWQKMWDMNRVGTEENVMTVLRWLHGGAGLPVMSWMDMLAEPQGSELAQA